MTALAANHIATPAAPSRQMSVLGIPVSLVNMTTAVSTMVGWRTAGQPQLVFVREVASLMAAFDAPALKALHSRAGLIVPDGTPLVWVGRLRGFGQEIGRVPGADLLDEVCAASLEPGQSHYFYGGKPGVAEEMVRRLREKYPGLKVAGTFSPPMRDIGPDFALTDETRAECEAIRASGADFIWVGLSSPKQEYWMAQAAPQVGKGVFVGIGAAFDFHSGAVRRAPAIMRDNGLEWLHRLFSEPKRLWRRYLVQAPRFVWLLAWHGLSSSTREQ